MHGLTTTIIQCPYCWEQIEIFVDASIPNQEYIEDCQICCRPMRIRVIARQGEIDDVDVSMEDA